MTIPLSTSNDFTDNLDAKLFGTQLKRTEIVTYSGLRIDPFNPDVDAISLIDIVHALSNNCRYGGHCPRFYSVAEHSVLVARLMEEAGEPAEFVKVGLLHDAEEAYMPDIPTPIKRQMPEYMERGDFLRGMIFSKYKLIGDLYPEMKKYDVAAYEQERKDLWNPKGLFGWWPSTARGVLLGYLVKYGIKD